MNDKLKGYFSPQIDAAVKLNSNESPVAPPKAFYERLAAFIESLELNRYPDRNQSALRNKLAQYHGVEYDNIWCANGSNEIILMILMSFAGAGTNSLVFEPTYRLHSHISNLTKTTVLTLERTKALEIDVDKACYFIKDKSPEIVFLCSPNNPTGRIEKPETVRAIVEASKGIVVIDEAYVQFAPNSFLEFVDRYENVIVTRTFSKTWSAAGLRVGYAISNQGIIDSLKAVTLPYNLNAISQVAATIALDFEKQMYQNIEMIISEREMLFDAMSELNLTVYRSDANFLLFSPSDISSKLVWEALLEASVLVRDCSDWPGLKNCLRVTVGTPEENFRFIEALKEILD
jgi:histidinol-phosphate aminotransferase